MPERQVEVLRRWARGDFYPLSSEGQAPDAVDELADEMSAQPEMWWHAFKSVFAESDWSGFKNLTMPFAALLDGGGPPMREEVASAARENRRIAQVFWDGMDFLKLSNEAYDRLGRQMTAEAFIRHEPRISSKPGQSWPAEWEDHWSGDALFYLTHENPEEAWLLCLELLAVSSDPGWIATVAAFAVEDLIRDHGDLFIDRIEAEAARNERFRMALPTTRWIVPEHLMARIKVAAGPYWDEKS
jgi:Family of unknown function (DUF6869)